MYKTSTSYRYLADAERRLVGYVLRCFAEFIACQNSPNARTYVHSKALNELDDIVKLASVGVASFVMLGEAPFKATWTVDSVIASAFEYLKADLSSTAKLGEYYVNDLVFDAIVQLKLPVDQAHTTVAALNTEAWSNLIDSVRDYYIAGRDYDDAIGFGAMSVEEAAIYLHKFDIDFDYYEISPPRVTNMTLEKIMNTIRKNTSEFDTIFTASSQAAEAAAEIAAEAVDSLATTPATAKEPATATA